MEAEVVSWPADCFVPFDHAEQLGWEKGPWTKVALVRHRVMSTERLLDHLEAEGMATYFYFGETTDWVFVKSSEATRAAQLLRGARGRVAGDRKQVIPGRAGQAVLTRAALRL